MLAKLAAAQDEYRSLRTFWERRLSELTETNSDLQARIQDLEGQLREAVQLNDVRARQAEHERRKALRHRERNNQLSGTLREVYRGILGGRSHEPLLDAALAVTGANRGLFLMRGGSQRQWAVRAAADFADLDSPDVDRVRHLCERLWQSRRPCLSEADLEGEMGVGGQAPETMRGWLMVPVTAGEEHRGALVVSDRQGGEFDEEDVEALQCVAEQAGVAIEHSERQRELRRTYVSTVLLLADAIELKDSYPRGHSEVVLRHSREVADLLELSPEERQVVSWVAMLHDVGKAGVSDALVNRPGPLMPQELEFVRSHAKFGSEMLASIPALTEVAHGVRHHHEHYNGKGYPDGLKGEEIPISARIISVVDAYQALLARRSYREAFSPEAARRELARCAGTQFDPRVVEAFLTILDHASPSGDAPSDEAGSMDTGDDTNGIPQHEPTRRPPKPSRRAPR